MNKVENFYIWTYSTRVVLNTQDDAPLFLLSTHQDRIGGKEFTNVIDIKLNVYGNLLEFRVNFSAKYP